MNKYLAFLIVVTSCVWTVKPMGFFRLTDESCFALSAGVHAIAHASTDDWVDPTLVGAVVTGGALWGVMQWLRSEGFVCADPKSKIIFATAGALAGALAGKAVRYTAKGVRYTVCAVLRKLFGSRKKQEDPGKLEVKVYPNVVEYRLCTTEV